MEDIKLTNILFTEFEWDGIVVPDDISKEEAEKHAKVVSDYLATRSFQTESDLAYFSNTIEVEVDNSFLDKVETDFEKVSNEELSQYLQSENTNVNPDYLFPKTDNIGSLFWFLRNLSKEDVSESKIKIANLEELSIHFYQILENALFFGYFERVQKDDGIYLLPTNYYVEFVTLELEQQYRHFLASLGRNETISEALRLQLNDPIFDSISRQMLYNTLVNDPNIQQESLTEEDLRKIVNNLRYWYLAIKKEILEDE